MAHSIRRKPSKEITVACCDEPIYLRSVSAMSITAIDNRFPFDPETKQRQDVHGYFAAVISKCVSGTADGDAPLWSEEQIRAMDSEYFLELWDHVGTFTGLKPKKDAEKN